MVDHLNRQNRKEHLAGFYDRIAPIYHEAQYQKAAEYAPLKHRQVRIERMIDGLSLTRGARILDVGCGPGELIVSLLRKGYDTCGVDISRRMADEASRTLELNGLSASGRVCVGDLEMLDFPADQFDLVIAAGVLEYQMEDGASLEQMRRVLKPRGHVIISVPNRYSYVTVSERAYIGLTRFSTIRTLATFFKRRIVGKGGLAEFPERRTYSPRRFDGMLRAHGFEKITHNYYRFSPYPVPLDSVFRVSNSRASIWMDERLTRHVFGIIGSGYLVLARKG